MSEPILILVIGTSALIVILIVLNNLFGKRLRRARFGVSPKEGIFGEFEIDTPVVKASSRGKLTVSAPPLSPPLSTEREAKSLLHESSILTPQLEQGQGKPEFMSDEYIVDLATRLQLESEEGDKVLFYDHTAEGEV